MSAAFPTRAEIDAAQSEALRALLGKLIPANSFYAPRLKSAGLGSDLADMPTFLRQMPFTLKTDIVEDQRLNPPFGSNLTYPIERYTRYHQTSGTSGAPIRWLDTPESWRWLVENWAEVFRTAGMGQGDRIFFAFSFGPFLGFWTAFDAGTKLGCLAIPGGGMSTAGRLRAVIDNECTALCCTPTYAFRLGEAALEAGIDLRKSAVRRIFLAGEPGGGIPSTRARLEQAWPTAKIVDHHGMTEIGPVSVECPERPGVLHILERAFIPEVVLESGDPVAPGEEGELVLTNLGRDGSPLLRYRTGDRVRLDDRSPNEPCACGRYDMALPGAILGRTDDMVVVRGVNVHPSAVEAIVRKFDQVEEFRVRLTSDRSLIEMEMEIEPTAQCTDPGRLVSEIESALRSAFNLRIPVGTVEPGSLPRFEMKARRWTVTKEEGGAASG
jgi:phenylacetate-CoA ligase